MSEREVRLLAWGSWYALVAASIVSVIYTVLSWDSPQVENAFGPKGFSVALALVLGTTGAIVASRRPSNPIGWILCASGLLGAAQAVGGGYAQWALIDQGGRPAGGTWGAWLEEWTWIPVVGSLGVIAAIFPDGRFLSRRWRLLMILGMVGAGIATVLAAIVPELTVYVGYDNPAGVNLDFLPEVASASISVTPAMLVVGSASAFVRFRRSHGDEREQLKWLATATSLVAMSLSLYGVVVLTQGPTATTSELDWAEYLMIVSLLSVPVAIGVGVLKYRLYDIDLVINKAVVYGGLAVFITLVYVVIVAGVGAAFGSRSSTLLSAGAAAVVALAFQPARRRAQHLANRLVYGKRATPYEVLSELSSRFAGTYSLEDALPRLARVTAEAVGAERARVWLRSDHELLPAAGWPDGEPGPSKSVAGEDLPPFGDGERAVAVRHQGELLGAISVTMPPSDPLAATEEKLLGDVAAQAGLVLRNVALLEDLRASRKRIVTAQDERARALERNIHDGAQQELVALTVKLRLAQGLAAKDPEKTATMLEELRADTQSALENLRDLARGIYPPLLADKGLRDAIEAQARKAGLPARIEGDGVGRYPQDVEAAVYFCTLEAFQNVAKYARASSIVVRLAERDGRLEFEIADDGAGFDPAATPRGSGLQNMVDRLEAVGGSVEVRSVPGSGTTVVGHVPSRREAAP